MKKLIIGAVAGVAVTAVIVTQALGATTHPNEGSYGGGMHYGNQLEFQVAGPPWYGTDNGGLSSGGKGTKPYAMSCDQGKKIHVKCTQYVFQRIDTYGYNYRYCGGTDWTIPDTYRQNDYRSLTTEINIVGGYFSYSGSAFITGGSNAWTKHIWFWGHFATPSRIVGSFRIQGCALKNFWARWDGG